jgi:hypothetical protein
MLEEVVVAHINVFYYNLPGGTEKTTQYPSKYLGRKFEPGTPE